MITKYYLEQQNDQLYLENQSSSAKIRELEFKVSAYEKLLAQHKVSAVAEELRIRQLLDYYPPTVPAAFKSLSELHDTTHRKNCACVERAKQLQDEVDRRNQQLVDDYDPYDDFVS